MVVNRLIRKSASQSKSMKRILGNFSKVIGNKRLKTELGSSKNLKEENNRSCLKKKLTKTKK